MKEVPADNIFGKILRGEIPSWEIHSDEHTYAFLDIFPQAEGHTLVIPRNYSENLLDAADQDVNACLATVRRLLPAVLSATGAGSANIFTNLGAEAGQSVPYLHFHIVPRLPGTRISMSDQGEMLPEEDARRIQAAIREALGQ